MFLHRSNGSHSHSKAETPHIFAAIPIENRLSTPIIFLFSKIDETLYKNILIYNNKNINVFTKI